jgi:cobalt/nickel transport system permease protein
VSGWLTRLDARARLLMVVTGVVTVSSTPPGNWTPFVGYAILTVAMLTGSGAGGGYLWRRCAAVSPFVLLAGGLLVLQNGWAPGGAVVLKGYLAALLLAAMTASTPLPELLWALRRLRAPESLNLILSVMYRYTGILTEEYARLARARECRTVRPLGGRRFEVYARQLGALILRSLDRAERVHWAMVSRGFRGEWPMERAGRWRAWDGLAVGLIVLLFVGVRRGA